MTLVESLKKFLAKLGGNPNELENNATSAEIIDAISEVYTDKEGTYTEVTPIATSGTKIATIKTNNTNHDIYAPKELPTIAADDIGSIAFVNGEGEWELFKMDDGSLSHLEYDHNNHTLINTYSIITLRDVTGTSVAVADENGLYHVTLKLHPYISDGAVSNTCIDFNNLPVNDIGHTTIFNAQIKVRFPNNYETWINGFSPSSTTANLPNVSSIGNALREILFRSYGDNINKKYFMNNITVAVNSEDSTKVDLSFNLFELDFTPVIPTT